MPFYYFDVERTGAEPGINMVLTIQYARLTDDFEPVADLEVLKVWEFKSERKLIEEFLGYSKLFEDQFTFIPVGVNTTYDLAFIYARARRYKLVSKPLAEVLHWKPFIDLKPVLVMINEGRFKDYDRFVDMYRAETRTRGADVSILFAKGDYDSIVEYVKDEYQATLKALKHIKEALEKLKPQ